MTFSLRTAPSWHGRGILTLTNGMLTTYHATPRQTYVLLVLALRRLDRIGGPPWLTAKDILDHRTTLTWFPSVFTSEEPLDVTRVVCDLRRALLRDLINTGPRRSGYYIDLPPNAVMVNIEEDNRPFMV